jgi:hypothetical protein
MPRALYGFLLTTSVVLGAALVVIYRTLPPRAAVLNSTMPPTTVLGGYHIHSNRSDGSGSVDAIAQAAHDAGLSYIVLTDHGDGTAVPLAPAYRSGVLCIDAVEISTNGGHVVALGLKGAAPFPMAGEPGDVIEDIHRRGGAAFVAHPDSPKPELQWRGWTTPYDGIEWMNADTEWRNETRTQLVGVAVRLLMRPPETIASLFRRPLMTIRRWDTTLRRRPVPAVAGLDAHANLAGWPRYVDMFKTLAQAAVLDAPLSGQADQDAQAILTALRAGHSYSIIRAFASPAALDFSVDQATGTAHMGDWVPADGPLTWRAAVPQAPNARLTLLDDGRPVASGRGSVTYPSAPTPGAYRVEVTYPGVAMPWIVSNPIYVGTDQSVPVDPMPVAATDVLDLTGASGWRVEHDAASTGQLDPADHGLRFGYALGGGVPASQFAAAGVPVEVKGSFDRVQLTVRADRPMRISVQVKLPGGGGQRWRRSAYVDDQPRALVMPLATFTDADRPSTLQPIASQVLELLIVVDTVNTVPGAHGTVWLTSAALGRAGPLGPVMSER